MSNSLIIVVTHKLFNDDFLPPNYRPIKVGNKLSNQEAEERNWLVDCTGENITAQNPWYCELTAQYWMWKNIQFRNDDIVGLTHYRRFFFNYRKQSKEWKEDLLSVDDARKILNTHKIIMNYPTVKLPGKAYLYKTLSDDDQNKHWRIIKGIIEQDYPEMLNIFKQYMYGRFTVWGNMFVTKGGVFREYNKWLFDIMKKYDLAIEALGEERVPRVDGFLTEHLLLIWANYKFKKSEIYHLEVRNTEEDSFEDYNDTLKGKLIHFIRCHRLMLDIVRYLRIGALLIIRNDAFGRNS